MSARLTALDVAKLAGENSTPTNALEMLLDAIDESIKKHVAEHNNPVGLRDVLATIPTATLLKAGARPHLKGATIQQHLLQEILTHFTVSGFTYSMDPTSRSNPPANPIVNLFWKTDLAGAGKAA